MNQKLASLVLALILAALVTTSAAARTSQPEFDRHAIEGRGYAPAPAAKAVHLTKRVHHKRERRIDERPSVPRNYAAVAQVVAHPAGCPRRAFCGCGTSLYLLGKAVAKGGLAIASKWLDLPRAVCAPRMAAARPGHVFAIIECLSGNRALAYDPNSGGHRTHIHVRSLAGYTVVNPSGGGRYASAH